MFLIGCGSDGNLLVVPDRRAGCCSRELGEHVLSQCGSPVPHPHGASGADDPQDGPLRFPSWYEIVADL